jgi:hypothetical protein
MCALGGCGEEEGANAGKIPAPTPPKDLEKLFQRPDKKNAPFNKKAQLFPPPQSHRLVFEADRRLA